MWDVSEQCRKQPYQLTYKSHYLENIFILGLSSYFSFEQLCQFCNLLMNVSKQLIASATSDTSLGFSFCFYASVSL